MAFLIVASVAMSATLAFLFLGSAWYQVDPWMYCAIIALLAVEWICLRMGVRDWNADCADEALTRNRADPAGVAVSKQAPFSLFGVILLASAAGIALAIATVKVPSWTPSIRTARLLMLFGIFRTFIMTKENEIVRKSGILIILAGALSMLGAQIVGPK
jgi:hypothetical protein